MNSFLDGPLTLRRSVHHIITCKRYKVGRSPVTTGHLTFKYNPSKGILYKSQNIRNSEKK